MSNILLFAIPTGDTGQEAVIDGIVQGDTLGMVDEANGSVDDNIDGFAQVCVDQVFPFRICQMYFCVPVLQGDHLLLHHYTIVTGRLQREIIV